MLLNGGQLHTGLHRPPPAAPLRCRLAGCSCPTPNACQTGGGCTATGACNLITNRPDGTACPGGTCRGGVCGTSPGGEGAVFTTCIDVDQLWQLHGRLRSRACGRDTHMYVAPLIGPVESLHREHFHACAAGRPTRCQMAAAPLAGGGQKHVQPASTRPAPGLTAPQTFITGTCSGGFAAPGGQCGASGSNKCCPSGQCCSQWGWCGITSSHCGSGCQRSFGSCTSLTAARRRRRVAKRRGTNESDELLAKYGPTRAPRLTPLPRRPPTLAALLPRSPTPRPPPRRPARLCPARLRPKRLLLPRRSSRLRRTRPSRPRRSRPRSTPLRSTPPLPTPPPALPPLELCINPFAGPLEWRRGVGGHYLSMRAPVVIG
jgi:hypothetical protein